MTTIAIRRSGGANITPDQGDIAWIDCDPSAGREIMKRWPVLVVSKKACNERTGFAVIVPIKTKPSGNPLEVPVDNGTETQGAAQVHQFRSLDYMARNAEFIERAPIDLVKQISKLIHLITAVGE